MAALAAACAAAAAWLPLAARADLPEVVASAKPAVVAVGLHSPLANPRFTYRGTGFVVGDGLTLVTNAHVLPEAEVEQKLALQLSRPAADGTVTLEWRVLTLKALDRDHDLAVLGFDGNPLPTLSLAADDTVREGQAIALMGFPAGDALGFRAVTHRGIVAAIVPMALPPPNARMLDAAAVSRLRRGMVFDIFQLDATAYPGNSGGPLLDPASGQVLGVVNMVLLKASREAALAMPSGISYAIPVRWVRALLKRG